MNGSGFDWLQVTSANNSGKVLPAPLVSFGGGEERSQSPLNGSLSPNFQKDMSPNTRVNGYDTGRLHNATSMVNIPIQASSTNNSSLNSISNLDVSNPANRTHAASFSLLPQRTQNYFSSSTTYQSDDDLSTGNFHSNHNHIHGGNNNNIGSTANNKGDDDDSICDSIPLSLQTHELTFQESKTYMRWYSDILARTNNARTISMNDVYSFLSNFKIPEFCKEKINRIFFKILHSINIGEFFALLRLISHALNGQEISRKLIKMQAPTPIPPSILSKKRHTEDEDDHDHHEESDAADIASSLGTSDSSSQPSKPLDLDSFTQFMLTGERPGEKRTKKRTKKAKSVKFSDQVVTDVHDFDMNNNNFASPSPQPNQDIDYSLPMDQLLGKIKQAQSLEEREILKDMESQINHFQNLNTVDKPTSAYEENSHNDSYQLLRPNMTGPAQMSQLFSPSPEPQYQQDEVLQPNMTGPVQMARLQPNRTGPADMARIFTPESSEQPKISLQSFTDQMTGNTLSNTLQNSRTSVTGSPTSSPVHVNGLNNNINEYNNTNNSNYSNNINGYGYENRPLPPPPVPQNRRSRSATSPPVISSPLSGSFGDSLHTPTLPQRNVSSPVNGSGRLPPPPPPSRRRNFSTSTTSPPPLPPKVVHQQQQPQQQSQGTSIYGNENGNDSTANLLTDLKALQDEVDRIRDMTGGF